MLRSLILLVICFSIAQISYAQVNEDFDDPEKFRVPADSTAAPIANGTIKTFKMIFSGKPGIAAGYALVIPGAGQLYNKRYWKAPIVWAADAAAITYFIYNRQLWLDFQSALEMKIEDPSFTYRGITSEESMRAFRNQFQLDTERAGIAIVIIHVASIIEAFTDRHLMEFDVSEDLSLDIQPQTYPIFGSSASLGITYTF